MTQFIEVPPAGSTVTEKTSHIEAPRERTNLKLVPGIIEVDGEVRLAGVNYAEKGYYSVVATGEEVVGPNLDVEGLVNSELALSTPYNQEEGLPELPKHTRGSLEEMMAIARTRTEKDRRNGNIIVRSAETAPEAQVTPPKTAKSFLPHDYGINLAMIKSSIQ